MTGSSSLLELTGGVGSLGATEGFLFVSSLANIFDRDGSDVTGGTNDALIASLTGGDNRGSLLVEGSPHRGPRQLLRALSLMMEGLALGADEAELLSLFLDEQLSVSRKDFELTEAAGLGLFERERRRDVARRNESTNKKREGQRGRGGAPGENPRESVCGVEFKNSRDTRQRFDFARGRTIGCLVYRGPFLSTRGRRENCIAKGLHPRLSESRCPPLASETRGSPVGEAYYSTDSFHVHPFTRHLSLYPPTYLNHHLDIYKIYEMTQRIMKDVKRVYSNTEMPQTHRHTQRQREEKREERREAEMCGEAHTQRRDLGGRRVAKPGGSG